MTANQITKKLVKAGVSLTGLEINRDEVEVCVGYKVLGNGVGTCDDTKTAKLARKVRKAFETSSSSSSTRYGAIIIRLNFTPCVLRIANID